MVAPDSALQNIVGDCVKIIKLRNPRTDQGTCFMINSTSKSLHEMMNFDEEHRSWFIGNKIVSDGRMIILTPVNPIFLIIPYLSKAERLEPLDQMLTDQDFPQTDQVLVNSVTESQLSKVADSKGSK